MCVCGVVGGVYDERSVCMLCVCGMVEGCEVKGLCMYVYYTEGGGVCVWVCVCGCVCVQRWEERKVKVCAHIRRSHIRAAPPGLSSAVFPLY